MISAHLYLNSSDSINTKEPHNCLFVLPSALSQVDCNAISLESVQLPQLRYPINSTNQTIVVEEANAATTFTATIPSGNYTGTSLATALSTLLTASTLQANTFSVIYDTSFKILSFSASATNFRITSSSTCLRELGFGSSGMTSAATSIDAPYAVQLDGTRFIDVISSLSANSFASNGRQNLLARIPTGSSTFGTNMSYEASSSDPIPFLQSSTHNIELRLYDDRGNVFTLPETAQVTYAFRLHKV